jgi:tetratricopeptide (TPR) repeat protein
MVAIDPPEVTTLPPEEQDGGDWHFAKESIRKPVIVTKKQQDDSSWFDFLFGPIPDPKQASSTARDATEETRESDSTSRSQPPADDVATGVKVLQPSLFGGLVDWLDPSPEKAIDKPKVEERREVTRDSRIGLDSVNLAVSEDREANSDNASTVSGVSSVTDGSQGKMFSDLDSLPSTHTQTDSVTKTSDDLDSTEDASMAGKNVATVVEEKALQIKIPDKNASGKGPNSPIVVMGIDIESKRQSLLRQLQSTVTSYGQYDVRVAAIDAALGDLFDESNKSEQAIKMHRAAVDIYSSKLGDDNDRTLQAKLELGRVMENAEKYDEAIAVYHQVTMMRRAIYGEKDSSAADSLARLAGALKKKEEYGLAIKELKRALKVYRESLGDAHEKVSITVDSIASLYKKLGDFEKAAAILEEVVKLKAATKGMKSKPVASTLLALASTYECAEDFSKSMKTLKKAYKIYTDMEGHSSIDATTTLDRIAKLYEATGDNDRASIAYLGVLRGRKMLFGEDDIMVAQTYFKLGHTLRNNGQYDKALKCMKEALPIFVSKGVEMHDVEMIAEVMHEMALMNKEKHRYSEAVRIFKQELGVRRKIGQPEFPLVARTLNYLGVTEYEMKNNNRALKYLIQALTIYKDNAERSAECAEVLYNTGLVFEATRNKNRALDAYNEALRIFRERGYNDTHPHLLKVVGKIDNIHV